MNNNADAIHRIYGWYDDPTQKTPVYDPPHDAACPICAAPLRLDDIRTHCIMWADRHDGRSYFYRTHRTCHEALPQDRRDALDGEVFDRIAAEFPA